MVEFPFQRRAGSSSGSRPASRQRSSSVALGVDDRAPHPQRRLVLRRLRDLPGLGVLQQVEAPPVAIQPGRRAARACSPMASPRRGRAPRPRSRRAGPARPAPTPTGPRCAAGPGRPRWPAARAGADQRRERQALADQRHQHDDERAELQQLAVRERRAVVGGHRQREDRREGDHAAGAGPAERDDLPAAQDVAPEPGAAGRCVPWSVVPTSPSSACSPSRVCSGLWQVSVSHSHSGRSSSRTPTVIAAAMRIVEVSVLRRGRR